MTDLDDRFEAYVFVPKREGIIEEPGPEGLRDSAPLRPRNE